MNNLNMNKKGLHKNSLTSSKLLNVCHLIISNSCSNKTSYFDALKGRTILKKINKYFLYLYQSFFFPD